VIGAGLWAAALQWQRPAAAPAASGASSTAIAPTVAAAGASAGVSAPASATPRLAERLRQDAADPAQAWRALSALWPGVAPSGEPCAAGQPLRCHRSAAMTLAQIRQLDRPGLLTLEGPGGRPQPVLLRGLTRETALLQFDAGVPLAVPLADLAAVWRGDFTTLWRPPEDAPAEAEPERHTRWLAARLGVTERPAASASAASDAASGPAAGTDSPRVRERVAAFQRAQGLAPDGRAGPLTLMQWNRSAGVDEPRLIQEP
jgi:general secretion pathway protein A